MLCYKTIDQGHPKAKFILTVRNEQYWKRSVRWEYWKRSVRWAWRKARTSSRGARPKDQLSTSHDRLRRRIYGARAWGWPGLSRVFREHEREVMRYFEGRPEDLLVINVAAGDGWEALCAFLNVPVPTATFPYTGKREPR